MRKTLLIVLLSFLTIPLTITGASVALPGIRAELGASLAATQWVVNGYNACFAAFLVFAGSLTDVLGRRRVFACGVALFCASSLAGALAGDILVLNVVRALGGIGAAAATTGGSSILAAAFDGQARSRAFGLLGAVLGAGLAFGPTAGGLLVDWLGWRAVFAVPAVISAVVLSLVGALPRLRGGEGRTVDWRGAVLFTTSLLLLIFALDEGPALGFGSPLVLGALVAAVAFGFVFVVVERRSADPMVELDLLADRRFVAFAVAAGALMGILVPLVVYLPSYLISVVGMGPGQAGLWLLMLTVPAVVLPPAGAALARVRPVATAAGSVAISGVGALLMVTVGPGSAPLGMLAPFALVGIGVGLSNGVLDGLAIAGVPQERVGAAAGLFNTARLVTETVVLAGVGAMLAALSGGRLDGPSFTVALHAACVALACLAAVATLSVIALAGTRRADGGNGPVPGRDPDRTESKESVTDW
ncbi:MFS transporter [Nonomuraea sp. bgisy101]|uniref:MFS transporter n=1 Tax=Nonomuraea sp. bgisy101 TaxID=3413784 RepID=UPI003D71C4EC